MKFAGKWMNWKEDRPELGSPDQERQVKFHICLYVDVSC